MSAVYLTSMGALYSGNGININAVETGDDGWIYLAGIDFKSAELPSYKAGLTVLAYHDGRFAWKQVFNDRAYGSFEALTFKDGFVYAAGAISTDFDTSDLRDINSRTISPPEKRPIDPALAALYAPKYPWFFQDPTYPIYVKLNGQTGAVELANVLPSPDVQGDDRLRSIDVDAQGNVYVGGGGWNPGPNPSDSFTGADFYWNVRKFNASGQEQWAISGEHISLNPYTGAAYLERYQDTLARLDPATGADLENVNSGLTFKPNEVSHWTRGWIYDKEGNVYILAGRTFWDSTVSDYSDQHGIIVKLNSTTGKVAWTTPFGQSADWCLPNSVTFSPDGNLLIAGEVTGSLEGKSTAGGSDGFLMTIDPSSGGILSTQVIGTGKNESIAQIKFQPVYDKATGITIDYNMIIGGSFEVRRYSLEGRDEKDLYLITDEGFHLIGNEKDNHIQGGGGADLISGGTGDDELTGGLGNDTLNGGTGSDTADFSDKAYGLTIGLNAGNATVRLGAETDTLISIENLIGGSAADRLTGDVGNNWLSGGQGNDVLESGSGNDVVDGGEGNDLIVGGEGAGDDTYFGGDGTDTVKYTSAKAGILVDLTKGIATSAGKGDAAGIGNDSLSGIENVIGGNFSDTVLGNDADNTITGGRGNDSVDGGSGSDTVVFSGARSAYRIRGSAASGSISVSSTAEGADLLTNIEFLQFSDQVVAVNALSVNSKPTGSLSINGKFIQGSTLTLSNSIVDEDGIPKFGPGAITYAWYADGTQIGSVSASSLLLNQDLVGKTISARAFYTDLFGSPEIVNAAISNKVQNINDKPTGTVVISGTATQGQQLTASNSLADADGLGVFSYQWNLGGKAIQGATGQTFNLTQAHVGQSISVTATYTDGYGQKESVTALPTVKIANINDLPIGQITIAGIAAEDQTLRAVTTALSDADGLGALKYEWQSSTDGLSWTPVKGATTSSYKLGDGDVGKLIRTSISYIDKHGSAESVTSEATSRIGNINDRPTGLPTISGRLIEGETLSANTSKIADADGLGSFSYLWQTSNDKTTWTDAGSGATLRLSGTSAKQFVQLTVSYTDGNGTSESVKSITSTAIASRALTLLGTLNEDLISGMSGSDTIFGNSGADTLSGGAGNDVFLYRSVSDSLPTSFDYILDFSAGDKIDLKGIDANASVAGDQAFVFSTTGGSKNAVWWDSGKLFGDVNGDAAADFAIHVSLTGLSELKSVNVVL